MVTTALALLSGGLDSTLAIKIILDQGIKVERIEGTLVRGAVDEETKELAASVTAAYGQGRHFDSVRIKMKILPETNAKFFYVSPCTQDEAKRFFV